MGETGGSRAGAKERRAAGVLLWRPGEDGRPRFLLLRARAHGEWGAPKGHLHAGEGEVEGESIVFRVRRCSWWDNLSRSGREKHVPCEFVDNTIFRDWLQAVDPSLGFEITRSLPRGDGHCEWVIRRVS